MATEKHRVKIALSQGGRSNRDNHSITLLCSATSGSFDKVKAKNFADAVSTLLSTVLFSTTHILRATFTQLDSSGYAVKGKTIKIPLSGRGGIIMDADDGSARDEICLALEKGSGDTTTGITLLRHAVSAKEEAQFMIDGSLPERFLINPTSGPYTGLDLGDALMLAAASSGVRLELPPSRDGLIVTDKFVTSVEVQDLRKINVTKRRVSAESSLIAGVQKQLNALGAKVKRLWRLYGKTSLPTFAVTLIAEIIAEAVGIMAGLPLAERALLALPAALIV
jgi:hypothetical protein